MRRAAVWTIALMVVAGPSLAQTRSVAGQMGVLGEWELTATVVEQAGGHWSGPLSLKHIGFCSADGPEVRTGMLRLEVSESLEQVTATLTTDGTTCTFRGRVKGSYTGLMQCPDRRDVPMMLSLQ